MRSLWDSRLVLSTSALARGMLVLAALAAALGVLSVLSSLGLLLSGHPYEALVRLASGLMVPLAVWLGVRILADMLRALKRQLGEPEEEPEAELVLAPQPARSEEPGAGAQTPTSPA